MWPLIYQFMRQNVKYLTFPAALVIGFIGYNLEGKISDRFTPASKPIKQQREDRLLENLDTITTTKKHSPLETNLSPSLSTNQ